MSDDDYHCAHHTCNGYCAEVGCDDSANDDCVHCTCCCTCLACEYGPRDGMLMFPDRAAGA